MANDALDIAVGDLLRKYDAKAVVFDLDGTLIDNNPYHLQAFLKYFEAINYSVTEDEYRKNINGRTNRDVFNYIFKKELSLEESTKHALAKEAVYREIYADHIKPVQGLLEFLESLARLHIPMAIATSGIQPNIDFFFQHVPVQQHFPVVVNSAHISKGKPDPEIYLKAAELLGVPPQHCIAFEDAGVGVRSAKAAGMHVVAILTTDVKENLAQADLFIDDYRFA